MSGHRLRAGGTLIDRGQSLSFTFAGRALTGYAGDTLASALLANGVRTVARSFKYHRRRGIVSAGPEEPCALVTLGEGAASEPNAKASMVPLRAGLVAGGQNAWPSLERDVMAVNGLAGPLIGAGFYYKTFIGGPRGTWTRLFEPLIRRAAGMGKAPDAPDPDRYETVHAFCDVLVVGGGPAGLAAAHAAALSGARVIIADERERPGGALMAERDTVDGMPAHQFAADLAAETAAAGATVLPRTTVYGHYDGQFGAVERIGEGGADEGAPRQRHWLIRPKQVIFACGAVERPIVFAGNDLPGVMLAEAARTYVNAYGAAPGKRAVVFACHDGAYRTVRDLAAAGIDVAAVIDPREDVPVTAREVAEAAGAAVHAGSVVGKATGRGGVRGVMVRDAAGQESRIAADCLLVSGGVVPTLSLTAQGACKPVWDSALNAFRPGALPDHWQAVGAMDGTLQTAACLAAGAAAGAHAAAELAFGPAPAKTFDVADDLSAAAPHPLFAVPGAGKAFVDLQHDVTAADVALAHDEGFRAVEHLKRYTTLGMATDQGKTSNLNGLALMAAARGMEVEAVGTTRFRPPASPIALGALAGAEVGAGVRPVRRTPMQAWHEGNGGAMVNTGAFQRPRAYLQDGETIRDAYIREARAVREGVGIIDVSTLGKIEVAGPDAATFLNRVYVNGFAKLPVGKARYGVMLRDDGMVMDDGTTWRLEEHRFLMTTTTANAGAVLARLELLLATAWPELKVHLTSVSEEWAGMAVAGPKSRATLAAALEGIEFANERFPFMAIRHGRVGEVPVMVTRLSFSGELAYEVYCGAHHGLFVWNAILESGSLHAITPYGTEAMGTLRIEKGHVSGSELDGRTTLHDLGLDGMASSKKAFVGKTMLAREALTDARRLRLVGLRALDGQPLSSGAHLTGEAGRSEGHVTAATHSPSSGAEIALALLERGSERLGERLTMQDPLRGKTVPVEVVSPVFVDPEGRRMHG